MLKLGGCILDRNPDNALEVSLRSGGYRRSEDVIRKIDLVLPSGSMLLIMGHNGAGKTSLLKAIFGLLPNVDADMYLYGNEVTGSPNNRVKMGLGYVAAGRHCFPHLSVRENFAVAGESRHCRGAELEKRIEQVLSVFPELGSMMDKVAGQMSGGQQRMVALGIGLVQQHRVLLIDEPSLGLAPTVVNRVYEAVAVMRQEFGMSVVVVEQNVDLRYVNFDELLMLRTGDVAFRAERSEVPAPEELLVYF